MASPPEEDVYVDMQSMAFRLPPYESDVSTPSVSTPSELIPEEVVWSVPNLDETYVSTSMIPSYSRDVSQARQAASLASVVPQEHIITIPNSELMRFKFVIIVCVAYAAISVLLNLWILIFVTKIKCA